MCDRCSRESQQRCGAGAEETQRTDGHEIHLGRRSWPAQGEATTSCATKRVARDRPLASAFECEKRAGRPKLRALDASTPTSLEPVHCPHADRCPGCPAIGLTYPAQLLLKRELVASALAKFDNTLTLQVPPPSAAQPIIGYRTRAKLVADATGALGLFEEGTHDVVDTPECLVLEPQVAATVITLRALLREKPILEGVDVVRVARGVLVTLIAAQGTPDAALDAFAAALQRADRNVTSVAASLRAEGAVPLLGGAIRVISGQPSAKRRLAPDLPEYSIAHGGFVQAHDGTAAAIQRMILDVLDAGKPLAATKVLELYAGAGGLALALAQRGAQVTAVESFKPACERLERAATEQKLMVRVVADDAARVLYEMTKARAHFDAIVVNPPRRGLDLRVRKALAKLAPQWLLYVSCNPGTLARDLSHLAGLGLRTQRVQPFDMMPLTNQVETWVLLSRGPASGHAILHEDDVLLALDKPPHLAVQEGEHSLLEWVHMREGWARAVPLLMLDVESSGVVLFARNAEAALPLDLALMGCTRRYQVLAKGITHAKGRISRPASLRARYQRSAVVGGHSLLDLTLETAGAHHFEQQLAVMRHPVIGQAKNGDRRTNLHFSMRHGLDRAFVHCSEVSLPYQDATLTVRAPLAPDLTLVIDSLSPSRIP